MRSTLLTLLFALAACGGDDGDAHAVGPCTGWTDNQGNPYTGTCETACKKPPASSGMTCDTPVQLHCNAFEFSGTSGCCVPDTADNQIKFAECTTEPTGP